MKKIATFPFISIAILLASCNNATNNDKPVDSVPATIKLDSKDVKGTMDSVHDHGVMLYTLTTNDPSNPSKTYVLNGVSIKLGETSAINITPAIMPFDSSFAALRRDLSSFGKFDTVELKPNAFFYHYVSTFGGSTEEGYNFLIVIKGANKSYILKGEGEHPMALIKNKAVAERTYKKALSFKPAD